MPDGPTFGGGAFYFAPVGTPPPLPSPAWLRLTPRWFRNWYALRNWHPISYLTNTSALPEGDSNA